MMKCLPLIISMAALMLWTVPSAQAQEDTPVFGKVTTTKPAALKTAPKAPSATAMTLAVDTDLRWVMGERKGKYVRVMVPRGPSGWVLETAILCRDSNERKQRQ